LCDVHENIHVKRNQTPYEAYSHDADKFEELKQRVKSTAMPYYKKQKFWQKEIDTDEIIKRELNDTRYICREAVKYLKGICGNVTGTRGKVTSELAYQWGFVKDRDDHRHHAIDAAVVAVTQNKHLRELGKTKYSTEGGRFSPPWADFREELGEKVKHINVSHRTNRKVSGALHEETSYGITGRKDEKGHDIFVYRKKLQDLTTAMVEKIVDPVVREIVKGRLKDKSVDLAGSGKIPKEIWDDPLYMRNRTSEKKVQIKKVRITDVSTNLVMLQDKHGNPYRGVKPGDNHHIEILEYRDKRGNLKREGKVVSLFEAVSRSISTSRVVMRSHGEDKAFVCSLCKGDMFLFETSVEEAILCRIQEIWESTNVVLRPHANATQRGDINKSASRLKGRKVVVDPLGRIFPAND
jgi:CRISPR-associated endonuclease Csn1